MTQLSSISVSVRLVATPWTRILVGPHRGWAYREIFCARVDALGDEAKLVADQVLRDLGYLLIDLPGGCTIEREDGSEKAAASTAA